MGQAAADLSASGLETPDSKTPNSTSRRSKTRVWLELGRVSNLPTVWSNVLAGAVLAGASAGALWQSTTALPLLLALTLFYLGGMYLNDACDAEIDARERADRPIPRGDIDRLTVALLGAGMLALGSLPPFMSHLPLRLTGLALTVVLAAASAVITLPIAIVVATVAVVPGIAVATSVVGGFGIAVVTLGAAVTIILLGGRARRA